MVIVVKIGGATLERASDNFFEDLKDVAKSDKVVLVHGGGKEVTSIAEKLGKGQTFITSPEGFRSRYTDRETAEIFTMVMVGKMNKLLVSRLMRAGVPSIGLSGLDGGIIRANRKERLVIMDERGRKRAIEGGYTGKITSVDTELLKTLMDRGYLPVISPVALGEKFEYLNIDADRTASSIAGSLKVETVIFFTDVEGVILDGKVVHDMGKEEVERQLPKIGPGMKVKVYAALEALGMGAKRAIVAPLIDERPVTSALNGKVGTIIHA